MTSDDATVRLIGALNAAGIPNMLVGSLASNMYGVVRATQDADLVVQPHAASIADAVLRLDGFVLDPQISFESVTATTRYIVRVPGIPFTIELFLLSDDPHDQSRFARRRTAAYLGSQVSLPTPEDVIVTKLRWLLAAGREKDELDVRNVLAVQGSALDFDYIHRWCDEHGTRELLDRVRRSIPPI
jgi:hypothetical protein